MGDKVVLTVETHVPFPGVAYLAYYKDGGNGAVPPYGDGYGGNGAGPGDETGTYIDAWVVQPNAPSGPARVDVTILYHDHQRQTLVVPFVVVDGSGIAKDEWC